MLDQYDSDIVYATIIITFSSLLIVMLIAFFILFFQEYKQHNKKPENINAIMLALVLNIKYQFLNIKNFFNNKL